LFPGFFIFDLSNRALKRCILKDNCLLPRRNFLKILAASIIAEAASPAFLPLAEAGTSKKRNLPGLKTAILIYDTALELDIFGPQEVFGLARYTSGKDASVYLVAERPGLVTLSHGTKIMPDYTVADAPVPDILITPGGRDTSNAWSNKKVVKFINRSAKTSTWLASVCVGSEILVAAGPAYGRRVATHHMYTQRLREMGGNVVTGARFVKDGNIISSAGVTSGIDMSLWLVSQIYGQEAADKVADMIEYTPAATSPATA
jgi:transcriptional regulator GlxA family with amidase domain